MAWACIHTIEGGHLEQYDKVNAEIGDVGRPEGLIVHVACPVEGGFRLIDVWDSREQYERFRDEHVIPAMTRVFGGEPSAPSVFEPLEVHRIVS